MTRFEEDIEEIYQANVHLHKHIHTLDDKLDRIEKLLLTLKPAAAPPTAGTNLR